MLQPVVDMSHEMFWRQFLRWLVSDTPARVVASTPHQILNDEGRVQLRAEVRDTTYLPAGDAQVESRGLGPDGSARTLDLPPDPLARAVYTAEVDAGRPGSFSAEVPATLGTPELGRR